MGVLFWDALSIVCLRMTPLKLHNIAEHEPSFPFPHIGAGSRNKPCVGLLNSWIEFLLVSPPMGPSPFMDGDVSLRSPCENIWWPRRLPHLWSRVTDALWMPPVWSWAHLHRRLHSTRSKGSFVAPTLHFSPLHAKFIKLQVRWNFAKCGMKTPNWIVHQRL